MSHHTHNDRGSVSLELVILIPFLIAVIGLLFFAARNAQAGILVTDIADASARTASLAADSAGR